MSSITPTGTRAIVLGGIVVVVAAAAATSFLFSVWIHGHRDDNGGDDDKSSLPMLPPHVERDLHKEERRKRMLPKLAMKKPMYDNILMQDPHGHALSTISLKKANWYINKDLADWIVRHDEVGDNENSEDNENRDNNKSTQSIIRLRFQPSNRIRDPDQALYHTSPKANHCVVCGASQHYMRHYVVPFCYRTLFPDDYKTHLSHDVVLTCAECHVRAEQANVQRRRRLERAARQGLPSITGVSHLVDRSKHSLAKQALALLKRRDQMPSERIATCQAAIRAWLDISFDQDLTNEHLQQMADIDYTSPNPQYIPGPVLVVQPLLDDLQTTGSDDALRQFVYAWREYFLETSQPRFLPTGWNIESPVQCDKRNSHSQGDTTT